MYLYIYNASKYLLSIKDYNHSWSSLLWITDYCSVARSCLTLCNSMNCNMPGFQSSDLQEFAQTHVHWVNDAIHLILCPRLLFLPSVFPSIRVFFNESALHIRWPKYWSFSFNISPSSECSGLISSRTDWFDLLAVQWSFRSLPQHNNWKALILWRSASSMIQLSHLYLKVTVDRDCSHKTKKCLLLGRKAMTNLDSVLKKQRQKKKKKRVPSFCEQRSI